MDIRESACHSKSKKDFPVQQDIEFRPERRIPRAHAGNGFKDQGNGQRGETAEKFQAEASSDHTYLGLCTVERGPSPVPWLREGAYARMRRSLRRFGSTPCRAVNIHRLLGPARWEKEMNQSPLNKTGAWWWWWWLCVVVCGCVCVRGDGGGGGGGGADG